MSELKSTIEKAYEAGDVSDSKTQKAIEEALLGLDQGKLRVASPSPEGQWQVNEWLKKAVLLYFKMKKNTAFELGGFHFVDKIPLKKWSGNEGVRVVPHALVRYGAHVASGAVLMPSYVNIGAFVDSGSMVDTWATVGSCAQIGKNVHLSGGVGVGGVLEPLQAKPVVIEDDAFIGSRCIIVEGVQVGQGAVLGAGLTLTASTRIIDVTSMEEKEYQGVVPPRSVVIPGTRPKDFPAGSFQVPCALIIGKRKESTDKKTSLNQVLRDFELSV